MGYDYIPDLTERFSEGFGGIDMTSKYYPSKGTLEYDWEDSYEDIPYEIDNLPKKFNIGEEYESVCWFTGGVGYYTVKAKDDESVTFSIGRHELDGDHQCEDETYELKYDDDGNEYVVLYEYGGHENRIRAGYDGYGNEIY